MKYHFFRFFINAVNSGTFVGNEIKIRTLFEKIVSGKILKVALVVVAETIFKAFDVNFAWLLTFGGVDFYMSPMDGSAGWSDVGVLIPWV